MLPIDEHSKLSIYIGEKLESDSRQPNEDFYHSYLMLIDETKWPFKVLQQLHFDADRRNSYRLSPFGLVGTSDPQKLGDRLKNVLVYPTIGGRSPDMLNVWNHALSFALGLNAQNLPFDKLNYKFGEKAINCRAGVIAVLEAVGVDYARGYYVGAAGTACAEITIDESVKGAIPQDKFHIAMEGNDRLMDRLGGNNDANRYIGPITGPVHVISPK